MAETWLEQQARLKEIYAREQAELKYQQLARGGLPKKVWTNGVMENVYNQDIGGTGGPRRSQPGGGNPEKKEKKNQAKRVVSQIFDLHGITETEINTDPDGIVTKKEKKIPSTLFDDEPFYSEARESARSSIATPPAPPAVTYDSGGDGPPTRQSNRPITAEVPTEANGTWEEYNKLYDDMFWQPDDTDDDSRIVSRVPFQGPTNPLDPSYEEPMTVTLASGEEYTYPDYTTTYSNGFIAQDATTWVGSEDDLAYWDPVAKKLIDEENRVIGRVENGDGTVTYTFNNSLDAHLQRPISDDEEEELSIAQSGVDALEAQIKAAELESVFISPSELAEMEEDLVKEKERLVNAKKAVAEKEANLESQAAMVGEFRTDSIIENEANKLEEKLDDKWAPDHPLDLEKVIKTLKEEDPSGKAIETLNDFATWSDTVPDEVAIREAETYLQGLKDSPTVSQRFRKAMAIAMVAMLFGDDFTTAMNTGFEVVADDYAAEAAAAKEIRDAQIELDKEIAKEERAFKRDNLKSHRDYIEALNLKKFELGAKALEDAAAAEALIKTNNQEQINLMAGRFRTSLTHAKDDMKANFVGIDFAGQMTGALDWLNNNTGFQIDLKSNKNQFYAFSNAFEEWMADRGIYGDSTPRFEVYARDTFMKTELLQYKPMNIDLITPTDSYLKKIGTDPKDVNYLEVKEEVSKLHEKILDWSGILGAEKYSIGLILKDFEDFKKHFPAEFGVLKKSADEKGEGVFTRFVNTRLKDAGSIGMNFDPEAKGKTALVIADMIRAEMKKIDTGKTVYAKQKKSN
jgi:hypothetical protein